MPSPWSSKTEPPSLLPLKPRLDGESHIESIEAEVDDPIGGAAVKSAALVIAERIEDAISVLQDVAAC